MKNDLRSLGILSALGLLLILAPGLPAQEKSLSADVGLSAATRADTGSAPTAQPAGAHIAPTESIARAGTLSDENPAAPNSNPADESASAAPPPAPDPAPAVRETAPPPPPPPSARRPVDQPYPRRGSSHDPVVAVFDNATLAADEAADAVVSVFGSSTSAGDVRSAVVSVFGDSRLTGGHAGDSVVSVFGNTYVNGEVRGQVVSVFGNVELGPDASVGGQIVCIAGKVTRDPRAVVSGHVQRVNLGARFGGVEWVQAWVTQCLLYARPLAIGPHLGWLWWITLGFLAFYGLVALVFRGGVEQCVQTLETRPGFSLLAALLTVLFVPVLIVLLIVTGIGIVFVPFVVAALFFASVFGKVVVLAWIGRRVSPLLGGGVFAHPAAATLLGGAIAIGLYLIPVIGFLVYKLIGVLGLGVVVYTLIRRARQHRVPAPSAPLPPSATAAVPATESPRAPRLVDESAATPAMAGDGSAPDVPPPAPPPIPPPVAMPVPPPAIPPLPVTAAPRAGFWIRLAASALDALLVAVAILLLPDPWQPNFLLAYAIYCVVLWTLKGATIGGIVCNLKVVRLDGRPVDGATALVRALGGFLSLMVVGLGFIWVAFDDHRQSWHDKIAGTTVVQLPKGVSLV
jgi:uncharacterized RDD family membrane protein YckC